MCTSTGEHRKFKTEFVQTECSRKFEIEEDAKLSNPFNHHDGATVLAIWKRLVIWPNSEICVSISSALRITSPMTTLSTLVTR